MSEEKVLLVAGARLKELHEAAKYALSHGNGQVSLSANELLEILPELPADQKTPSHFELNAKALQDKEAASEKQVVATIQEAAAEITQPAGPVVVAGAGGDPALPKDEHAEQVATEITAETGAKTEVKNGVPTVDVPAADQVASPDTEPAA